MSAFVIALAAGASLSFVFVFLAAVCAEESPAYNAFINATSCASKSGFLTSLILSLNIVFAVAISSEITCQLKVHAFLKCQSDGIDDTSSLEIDLPSLSTMFVVVISISYATFSCKVFISSFIFHAFLHSLF